MRFFGSLTLIFAFLGLPAGLLADAVADAEAAMRQGRAQMQKNDEELKKYGVAIIKINKSVPSPSGGEALQMQDYPGGFRCLICRQDYPCNADDQSSLMAASQQITGHMCDAGHGPYVVKCNGEPCDKPEYRFELAPDAKAKCERFLAHHAEYLAQAVSFKGGVYQGSRMKAKDAAAQFLSGCICENKGAGGAGSGSGTGDSDGRFGGDGTLEGLHGSLVGMRNKDTERDVAAAKAGVEADKKDRQTAMDKFHDKMMESNPFKDRPLRTGGGKDQKGPDRPKDKPKENDKLNPTLGRLGGQIGNLPD